MLTVRVKLADCAEGAANEALQTGSEINANLERLTLTIAALHGTVLVLAVVAAVYLVLRSKGNGTN
jgi:hypothetical protein